MIIQHLVKGGLLALLLVGWCIPAWAGETVDGGDKVVFQVDETRNARWAMMLANGYLDENPKASVVFVTYGPGIDFLLEDAEDKRGNPYDPAVLSLVERGVEFRVCAGTLGARKIPAENVLDAAVIVPSGVIDIVRLQTREGYAYLKP